MSIFNEGNKCIDKTLGNNLMLKRKGVLYFQSQVRLLFWFSTFLEVVCLCFSIEIGKCQKTIPYLSLSCGYFNPHFKMRQCPVL